MKDEQLIRYALYCAEKWEESLLDAIKGCHSPSDEQTRSVALEFLAAAKKYRARQVRKAERRKTKGVQI